jgi:putative SOS response-associated peptidase YedK
MCGRFTLKTPVLDWLMSLFPRDRDSLAILANRLIQSNPLLAAPRFNISPTQPIWGITQNVLAPNQPRTADSGIDGYGIDSYGIRGMRWGLLPAWADSPQVAYSMINARSETLWDKPSYKNLIPTHRCAIVADGYFEWKKNDIEAKASRAKQPYWIHRMDEKPFAMAGLWTENKKVQPGHIVASATIITTDANQDTESVHDRMPVLLMDPESVTAWLSDDVSEETLRRMVAPAPTGSLQMRAVSTQVNSPRNDGPRLLEPVTEMPAVDECE